MLREITHCEVCQNKQLTPVLNLGSHPLCDDLVPFGDSRICEEYPIEILFCSHCCTAHQRFQVDAKKLFPNEYHYRARHTADVINGMRELVDTCIGQVGALSGKKILDIGCNDGSLLSIFKEKGAITFGIEPTGAYQDAIEAGHHLVHGFFTEDLANQFVIQNGKPDVITFTNVFAHIEDLAGVIRALKVLLHETTVLVIENHYLGAVIDKFQFDTFYHEHPRTYSYRSFVYIANSLGMDIGSVEFPERYNGNIRIIYIPKGEQQQYFDERDIKAKEDLFGESLKLMEQKLVIWKKEKGDEIELAVKKHGKLNAKAFPGRAAIPIKLLGLNEETILAVYEKPTSDKVGHYLPGTRIPIVSDNECNPADVQGPLINLAWHIRREIEKYMQTRGYKGEFIDIIS